MKYTLINNEDCSDTIEIEMTTEDDPQTIALNRLGWHLVPSFDPDENQLMFEL